MKQRKVLAAIRIDTFAGRSVMSGIVDHIDANHPWQLRILQNPADISTKVVHAAEAEGYDGFLFSFLGDAKSEDAIRNSKQALVLIGSHKPGFDSRRAPTSFVWTDNMSIGSMGGDYLAHLGRFSSFAFVYSHSDSTYSRKRQSGFSAAIRKFTGTDPTTFVSPHPVGSAEDCSALSEWLLALPKPTAVMAACDWRALQVIAAAEQAGLSIPEQISLLGVDNDELIATRSHPPLSSIQLGLYNMGLRASAELERLMSTRRANAIRTTFIPPVRIVERESTGFVTPAAMLTERAQKFIREHIKDGIGVADVIAHLGCSRSLADLRFRENAGTTLHAAIESARLDEVKRMLKTTSQPMRTIASLCGFKSASTLAHLFQKRFGMTTGAWRLTAKASAPVPSKRGHENTGKRTRRHLPH